MSVILRKRRRLLACSVAAIVAALPVAVLAQAETFQFNVPSQSLDSALRSFARTAHQQVLFDRKLVAGKRAPGLTGRYTADTGVSALLAWSGLQAVRGSQGAYIIKSSVNVGTPTSGEADAGGAPATDNSAEIIVTGTRIRGAAPVGSPLLVVGRKAIDDSGHATVAEYIQTIPQNYSGGENEGNYRNNPNASDNTAFGSSVNLRGLGTESTLVLFDGVRPALGGSIGAFVDTSLIPTGVIDRIEILTDGASAIYGTDAVAGVVNVRFRNRYQGAETRLYSGIAAGGAMHELQASQTYGRTWNTGSILLAYQFDHRSRLAGDSRAMSTENLTRWGGPDNRGYFSVPGTLIAADGSIFAIPSGQNGRDLSASDLIPGQANKTDRDKRIDLLPQQTVHSAYAAIDQKLFRDVSFYARALYAHRAYDANIALESYSARTVPVTNPFYVDPIGTGEPVSVAYDFSRELGNPAIRGHIAAFTTIAGLHARAGTWSFDLNGTYGNQKTGDKELNNVSSGRAATALADTDPSTALNLFGDGTGNNPATLDLIRSTYKDFSRSTIWSAALRIDGSLLNLPAGTVKVATGAEYRHEYFAAGYLYNSTEASPDIFDRYDTPGTPGRRHVSAVYGELSIPILNRPEGAFPGRIDASVAGRADWYSDVGRTVNPKAGLSWEVVPGVKLRASWGKSFRAPTFYENGGVTQNSYYSYQAPDSHSPTGSTPVLLLNGYSPDLRPEKATSWTAGVDLKPKSAPGLTLGATYFEIDYRDRIASPAAYFPQILSHPEIYGSLIQTATPAEVAAVYANPQFVNYFNIPASDIQYILNLETQNLSRTVVRGVDFNFGYSRALLGGTGALDLNGTRIIAFDQAITADSPAANIVAQIYSPVRWRMRGHLGWGNGRLSADLFTNYSSGYLNTLVSPSEHVKSWTTFDAQLGYHFAKAPPFKGASIALSATNLFNRAPPYVLYSVYDRTYAYDPNQASIVGRLISARLSFDW